MNLRKEATSEMVFRMGAGRASASAGGCAVLASGLAILVLGRSWASAALRPV